MYSSFTTPSLNISKYIQYICVHVTPERVWTSRLDAILTPIKTTYIQFNEGRSLLSYLKRPMYDVMISLIVEWIPISYGDQHYETPYDSVVLF